MGSHSGVGGDWDVHWGYDLDFDLWPKTNSVARGTLESQKKHGIKQMARASCRWKECAGLSLLGRMSGTRCPGLFAVYAWEVPVISSAKKTKWFFERLLGGSDVGRLKWHDIDLHFNVGQA